MYAQSVATHFQTLAHFLSIIKDMQRGKMLKIRRKTHTMEEVRKSAKKWLEMKNYYFLICHKNVGFFK